MLVSSTPKACVPKSRQGLDQKNNTCFLGNPNSLSDDKEAKNVSAKEGFKLVGSGFLHKGKDLALCIFKHPLKTIGVAAGTSIALGALPLVGIASSTGAAVLGLGFAALTVGKTAKDSVSAFKHSRNNEYAKLRSDLRNIGGDGVDLALTVPFVPKAIKAVKNYAKFGPKIQFNKEYWRDLRATKNPLKHIWACFKANLKLKYEQITNEMGLKIKPKLLIGKDIPAIAAALYEPEEAVIKVNPLLVNPLTGGKQLATEGVLRHELEHFRQFSDIVNTKNLGTTALEKGLDKYNTLRINWIKELSGDSNLDLSQIMPKEKKMKMNMKFYQQVIDNSEPILPNSPKAKLASKYLEGCIQKVDDTKKIYNMEMQLAEERPDKSIGFLNYVKQLYKHIKTRQEKFEKIYKSNILEKEAYAAQDKYYDAVIKNRPGFKTVMAQAQSTTTKNKKQI